MLGTYIEIILYPVKKYLEMLTDTVLASHLGVSVLGIAVTSAIAMIVVTALVYKINAGSSYAAALNLNDRNTQLRLDTDRRNRLRAINHNNRIKERERMKAIREQRIKNRNYSRNK